MAGPIARWLESGWGQALFVALLGYPLWTITSRIALVVFEAHPIVYISVTMLAAAICLMVLARPGLLGIATLKRPETWLYGLLIAVGGLLSIACLEYVSAAELSLLQCISTVVVFILSFFFLGQQVRVAEWLSLGCISLGIVALLSATGLPSQTMIILTVLLVARGLAQALQQIVTEVHKANRAAQTFHQNIRVTAMVMGVTGMMFIAVFASLAGLKALSTEPLWPSLPTWQDFLNWPMFVYCAVVGCLLHAPVRYCEFYATKKISAKYFMAAVSVQPVFTMVYERGLTAAQVVSSRAFGWLDYTALLIVVLGSLALAISGFKRGAKGYTGDNEAILDPATIQSLQQNVRLAYNFAGRKLPKTAQLLGLTVPQVREFLQVNSSDLVLTKGLVARVQERYAQHVAAADPLTGCCSLKLTRWKPVRKPKRSIFLGSSCRVKFQLSATSGMSLPLSICSRRKRAKSLSNT